MIPLVGCDPEIFVFNKEENRHVSAFGLVQGTKDLPHPVKDGMVQVDGMALEFGIDPAASEDEFFLKIKSVLNQLQVMLPKHLMLDFKSSVIFDKDIIDAQPPEALELGCDPDYNCYTGLTNQPPQIITEGLRSAGGHIHIGWCKIEDRFSPEHLSACRALTAAMDEEVGVPSLFWDLDVRRRSLYGAAGAFRPKVYGMEYRTTSNQWLLKEEYIRYVYRKTVSTFQKLTDNNFNFKSKKYFGDRLTLSARDVVNNGFGLIGRAMYEGDQKNV